MRRHIIRNSRWMILIILTGSILAIVSCAKKKSTGISPIEAQPAVTSPGHEMTEEELAAQHQKDVLENLKKPDAQKFVNEDVHFDFDDATLRPDAIEILKKKVEWLNANPTVSVTIEGHCDERGTVAYNIALGETRAENIKAFLVDAGTSADRLHVVSYGSEKPVDPGHDEEAWAKNRRGHFRFN